MSAALEARAPVPVHWHGLDACKGDLIDRLAAAFQRARLWKRRARQQLVEARARGDECAVHATRVRYQRACHWHVVFYRNYLRAIFAAYG
ncbi:MAG: hypothetical protein ACR2NO_08570 [Chloroflexota bacterium]